MSGVKKIKKSMEAGSVDLSLIALRDFVICQNAYLREIKKGDDVSDVPEMYHQNLIAEGVIAQGKEK